ncbi:sulfate ABC transporter substrate-binding protein [Nocardioides cynanchi]|uniref:sulfate ABC transporter substrate-binding protein n=1 Tax=Nocardioides cynanchi TaxID=2558918 RepID=UPI001243DAF1|nr:sulfate ABC transporter substrate-binding protein [Nocardioides cynanchi]
MTKRIRLATIVAAATIVPALLSGCGSSSGSSSSDKVSVVGFSVLKTANEPVIADFKKTAAGKGVSFTTSYGASGDQSRAVIGGLPTDEVHLSLEPDVSKIVDAGLIDSSWNQTPTQGILTDSEVVFLVRKGNPLGIKSWDDLTKPGVKIVTPNPASSGSAKWNILAAWAHVSGQGGTDAQAQAFVDKLLHNVVALPGSGSDALASFVAGNGDVLLAYENDSIAARAAGDDVDYIVPDDTLLIQNPVALTKDASTAAKAFLKFQLSTPGQTDYAKAGFRPVISGINVDVPGANDPSNPFPAVKTQYTIDKTFGGWDTANTKFFDETNGIITKMIAGLHVGS